MNFSHAFNSFLKIGYKKAIDDATKGTWTGEKYILEICTNGKFKVHNGEHLQVDKNSISMWIPALNDTEWSEDPKLRQYQEAISELKEEFNHKLEEYKWRDVGD